MLGLGAALGAGDAGEQREAEAQGLAGAGTATAQHVLAGQGVRDGRGLDRERGGDAALVEGADDVVVQAQVTERDGGLGRLDVLVGVGLDGLGGVVGLVGVVELDGLGDLRDLGELGVGGGNIGGGLARGHGEAGVVNERHAKPSGSGTRLSPGFWSQPPLCGQPRIAGTRQGRQMGIGRQANGSK